VRHLVRLIAIRHLKAAPGRTLLTLSGIALGVAVMFAINLVNASVMSSFRHTMDQVAGKTALTIGEGSGGVAEELLTTVREVKGVALAVPVIRESVRDLNSGAQLAVMGVDTLSDSKVRDYDVTADDVKVEDEISFLNDPNGVIVTKAYAQKTGIKIDDKMKLQTMDGPKNFTVRGSLEPRGAAKVFGGDLLLMDVYAAQMTFGRGKRFDNIDVVPEEGTNVQELATRIKKALGGKASVERPQRRSQEAEQILAGFMLALKFVSLVALFVGGFIVYNALAIAVAQRRREIGTLRALGTTRTQILMLFASEGVVMGAIGAALGLAFGFGLARAVLALVGTTVSTLYQHVEAEKIVVTPLEILIGAAGGVSAAFVAALFPARRAAQVEPATAMRKTSDAADAGIGSASSSLKAGIAALGIAALLGWVAHVRESTNLGFVVAACLVAAAAAFAPAIGGALGKLASALTVRRTPAVRLGVLGFSRNAGRNAVAVAALGLSLANVHNVASVHESIRHSTLDWLDRSARADVFVLGGTELKRTADRPLSGSLGPELAKLDGVEFVNSWRMVRQRYKDKPYYLLSSDLVQSHRYNEIPVVEGDIESALPQISAGKALAASESFARTFDVKLGDELTVDTPSGPHQFKIALIYVDYNQEAGILSTTTEVYRRLWNDSLVDWYGVFLSKGTPAPVARERIAREWGGKHDLMVLGNGQFKSEAGNLIDRSFALSRALELVAIIVAVLGIVTTLLVAVTDRRTELGILKAIGAVRSQVARMFIVEASLIGLAASVVGAFLGTLLSMYAVKELLRFEVGWYLTWRFATAAAVETFIISQVAALIGAWWPMRSAAKLDVVDALQYE
jgi:putative ABC transport system permease protein